MIIKKDKYLTLRVTEEVKALVQEAADENRCTVTAYLLRLAREDARKNGRKWPEA